MKKKKKKNGVPDRWLDYRPVGRRIPGTRFIAFKVPLNLSLNRRVPESDSFGFWDLLDSVEAQNQELGLIIDLTFTTKYYRLTDVPQSCCYIKILTQGHQVPSDGAILSFKRAVRHFLKENQGNDKLIGVHCTHGLNRTGYLVCRYLIDVDGLDPPAALELFNSCRGHRIERRNYLNDLHGAAKRSNDGIDKPEEEVTRGLAVERPPRTAKEEGRPPRTAGGEGRPPRTAGGKEHQSGSNQREEGRLPQTVRQKGPPPRTVGEEGRPPWTAKEEGRPPQTVRQKGPPPRTASRQEGGPAQISTTGEEGRRSGDNPTENQQPDEKRPPGNRRQRRTRHRRRADHESFDRPPQDGLLPTYHWNPAHPAAEGLDQT